MKNSLLLLNLISFCFFAAFSSADICKRSRTVYSALEKSLKKSCREITSEDLLTVTNLELPHIHLQSFLDNDFEGLTNLKRLHFFSLFHNGGDVNDPTTISEKVFADLSKLEELVMKNDELGLLPDKVFSGLVSLKILDLSNSELTRLPKSMLTLSKIEKIYFEGNSIDKSDFQLLKSTFGARLESRR